MVLIAWLDIERRSIEADALSRIVQRDEEPIARRNLFLVFDAAEFIARVIPADLIPLDFDKSVRSR